MWQPLKQILIFLNLLTTHARYTFLLVFIVIEFLTHWWVSWIRNRLLPNATWRRDIAQCYVTTRYCPMLREDAKAGLKVEKKYGLPV
jgi:hypothetical protein